MNKYLLMSAAALLGSAAVASADDGSKSGRATVLLGTSACSSFVMNWNGPLYAIQQHGVPTCGSSVTYEIGIAGKTKGIGNNLNFGVPPPPAGILFGQSIDLSLPLKTGGAWTLYGNTNGSTVFVLNAGTYTVQNGARAKSGSRTSLLSQAIEQLKQRNAQ